MTAPTQGEVRSWARTQGIAVNPRGSLPAKTVAAYMSAHGSPEPAAISTPAPSGTLPAALNLAGALTSLLESIGAEVDAVTSLSDRIDGLVSELNAARQEQATRLTVLDELQAAVEDPSLGAFFKNTIRPRGPKVAEVVPDRLK